MRPLERLALVLRLALGNVRRHRGKSLVVGAILAFGTMVMVMGNALVDAVDRGMTRSITWSLTGHLQIHRADARDELALFGDGFAGVPDLGVMPDFAKLAEIVGGVPGVKAVVPMGTNVAIIYTGNTLDGHLSDLRSAMKTGDGAAQQRLITRIRHQAGQVVTQIKQLEQVADQKSGLTAGLAEVTRATTDAFWAEFQQNPEPALEFLDNEVAPRQSARNLIGLRFVGTDPEAFEQHFERFEIARGQGIPAGERGFLFNEGFYERFVKHRVARDLDRLAEGLAEGATIAGDARLKSRAAQLPAQYARIAYQLDPDEAATLIPKLVAHLGAEAGAEADLPGLLKAFLEVTDANFKARRAFFDAEIAPLIDLYRVGIGETVALKTATRTGYTRSAQVKVFGTFRLVGLERSQVASVYNMVDLVTFRDLFGLMTDARKAEVEALRAASGVRDVQREDVEADLFGEPEAAPAEEAPAEGLAPDSPEAESPEAESPEAVRAREVLRAVDQGQLEIEQIGVGGYSPDELRRGVVPHAAILLDESVPVAQAQAAIQAALDAQMPGLKVVDWQSAAGLLGQAIEVIRIVLFVTVSLLLLVALVIINNAMVMATMERTHEIGTMRAIGAGRGFVMGLFLTEASALALVAGGLGAAAGAGLITWMGQVGLPSTSEFTDLLFSGRALHPQLESGHVSGALILIFVFAGLSALYPARLAARVAPARAMAGE